MIYGVVFLVVMATFGLVASPAALLVPLLFVLGALTFAALGMTYTALVTNIEHFNIFYTGLLTPMFLFGGVFFPFDRLPTWAQVVGWCLPLSHLVAAARALVLGGLGWAIAAHAGALAGLRALLFPIPLARLSRTLLR